MRWLVRPRDRIRCIRTIAHPVVAQTGMVGRNNESDCRRHFAHLRVVDSVDISDEICNVVNGVGGIGDWR